MGRKKGKSRKKYTRKNYIIPFQKINKKIVFKDQPSIPSQEVTLKAPKPEQEDETREYSRWQLLNFYLFPGSV